MNFSGILHLVYTLFCEISQRFTTLFLQDLVNHIYFLVPLQDAARAACVSRQFLHCWRHYPNLTLNWKTLGLTDTKLGLNEETSTVHGESYKLDKRESYLVNTIDHILKNHSGIGLETLKIHLCACANEDAHYLDSWLQMAAKSDIRALTMQKLAIVSIAYDCMSRNYLLQCNLFI